MRRAARWAIAGSLTLVAACNPQPPKPTPSPSVPAPKASARATPLVLKITGKGTAARPIRFSHQVHNRIDYDLLASSFVSKGPQGDQRAVFKDARVTFRDAKGSAVVATAPHALVDQTADTVTLIDGVHARTSSGMTLQCSQLVYSRASGMLHGTGAVVVTDPKGFRATGSSFDSDLSLTHMQMR